MLRNSYVAFRGLCEKSVAAKSLFVYKPTSALFTERKTVVLITQSGFIRRFSLASTMSTKRHVFEAAQAGGITALQVGAPSPFMLEKSSQILLQATTAMSADSAVSDLFQYGPTTGLINYREELAKFLSDYYKDSVNSENLFLTNGATAGIHCIATLMFPPGGNTVFIEDPTYFLALNMLRDDFGYNIKPVPSDTQGLDVDAFENMLIEFCKSKEFTPTEKYPFRALVYTVPIFNNPLGTSLPPERCEKLIKLARKYDLLLIADDIYNLLNYNFQQDPPPRLLTYDRKTDPDFKGNVISNGTFSKIFSPGVRCGWMEASDRIISCLAAKSTFISSGAVNHTMSSIMSYALKLGLMKESVESIRKVNAARVEAAAKTLTENLPPGCSFYKPEGGYFIWVILPADANATAVLDICKSKYKVTFVPGEKCSASGSYRNCIRLSIAFYDEDVLVSSMKSICASVKEHIGA